MLSVCAGRTVGVGDGVSVTGGAESGGADETSSDGEGEIATKPITFSGKHLFVNADCRFGSLKAEFIGRDGRPIPGFSREDCSAFSHADSTKTELAFKGGDLSALVGKTVRLRFFIHCGTLYSFWVSPSARGEARGYVAAGGPDYAGLRDI